MSPKKSPNDLDKEKLYSINSMVFNNPKKLVEKKDIGPVLKEKEILQPRYSSRKRPLTSRESNRSQSGQKNKLLHRN